MELTNLERQKAGLPTLAANAQLTKAAQDYAAVLAGGTCFSHRCGSTMTERIQAAGYTNWSSIGENIAAGQATPEAVVASWMASPDHRANILSANYREIGVGFVRGGAYSYYWVQEFGARFGS